MGGIYIDMEAFHARLVQDCNEMLTLMGLEGCMFAVALEPTEPRPSIWQRVINFVRRCN